MLTAKVWGGSDRILKSFNLSHPQGAFQFALKPNSPFQAKQNPILHLSLQTDDQA